MMNHNSKGKTLVAHKKHKENLFMRLRPLCDVATNEMKIEMKFQGNPILKIVIRFPELLFFL